MTPEQEKVLTRVKKMLALAADAGASEGERDNALRMAHKALAVHNLSLSQVDEVGMERLRDCFDAKPSWAKTVCSGIGALFFCKYYRQPGGKGVEDKHYFVGTAANVATAIAIAGFVVDSIIKEVKSREKMNKLDGLLDLDTINIDRNYKASFADGAALKVYARCIQMLKDAKEETGEGTGIVLASYYDREKHANNAYLASLGVKLVHRATSINQGAGFAAGQAYGEKVSLNRQVGGRSSDGTSLRLSNKGAK